MGSLKKMFAKVRDSKNRRGPSNDYATTGNPGGSEQYTGIEPGKLPTDNNVAPPQGGPQGGRRRRPSKRLGGARTPMSVR